MRTSRKGLLSDARRKGGWTKDLCKDWLRTVWSKINGLTKKKVYAGTRFIQSQLVSTNTQHAKCLNTEPIVIPGGMTGMVQPLDVAINKPFKYRMTKKWQEWMLADQHTFTASGRIHKVELPQICQWISEA